jgi:two-component sensor histidine kinase
MKIEADIGEPRLKGFAALLDRFFISLISRHQIASVVASMAVYLVALLAFGDSLEVASNYFVILPILILAANNGLLVGFLAGAMGLPMNLALFELIGHPEYAPENWLIAFASGCVVGTAFGFIGEYFKVLQAQVERGKALEAELRMTLKQKEALHLELHHRVKNNLNVIKSIIQLQGYRSEDPLFKEALAALRSRVFAIARLHDHLYDRLEAKEIDPAGYLTAILADNAGLGLPDGRPVKHRAVIRSGPIELSLANSIGIVANELIMNSIKHAFAEVREPELWLEFIENFASHSLRIGDNGPGIPPEKVKASGLGMKVVGSIASQLKAETFHRTEYGYSIFELRVPKPDPAQ